LKLSKEDLFQKFDFFNRILKFHTLNWIFLLSIKDNNNMKMLNKIGLFLSSFVPLFFLIIIKEIIDIINRNLSFNFLNTTLLLIVVFCFIFGLYTLLKNLKECKNCDLKKILILKKKNTTDEHFLGYFSLFVLFAVSFEIELYSMAMVFFVVLAMIGIVYIKNDMYYINPLLNLLGYSFYKIKYKYKENTYEKNMFFKGQIIVNKEYYMCGKYTNLTLLKKIKK